MALRFSLSLLLLQCYICSIFSLVLHASVGIAHNDPIIQTMEEFSGYPPIQEPLVPESEEALQNQIRIVRVRNLSLWASARFIISSFSSCGDIESVEIQSKFESSQIAFVTFKHSVGAACAVMLSLISQAGFQGPGRVDYRARAKSLKHCTKTCFRSNPLGAKNMLNSLICEGTKFLDLTVTITLAPSHEKATDGAESFLFKTKDVFSSIFEKGYVLGREFAVGTSDKVQQVERKLQVSEKLKSAIDKTSVWIYHSLSIGASWATVAFDSIAKAAAEVSQHAKEKAAIAEEEQRRKATAEEEQRRKATAEEEQRRETMGLFGLP